MSVVPPGVRVITGYRRAWLGKDVTAGIVLTTLLVPQGMAYAELAGLPPITGLYTSIMCLLGYAVFGPSRILVLGPDSALGPMIAATTLPLLAADGDPQRAVALASLLALMVGAIMVLVAVAKLGFIADLLSRPTMIGYMNGLALTILIGQLPKLFGFSVDADGLIGEIQGFVQGVADGEVVPAAAAVGLAGIVLILVLQRWLPKVPAVLVGGGAVDRGHQRLRTGGARRERDRGAAAGLPAADHPHGPRGPTSCRWRPGPWPSRWCPWPTPSPPRRRSPSAPARRSTATRRCSASARRTSPPACSRASRSAPAPRAPRWPSAPARRPS